MNFKSLKLFPVAT